MYVNYLFQGVDHTRPNSNERDCMRNIYLYLFKMYFFEISAVSNESYYYY